MAVEASAHVPQPGKITSGSSIANKLNTDDYWKNKAQEARARREYEEETKNIEALRNPQAPEPPVKMTGSINLGNIDFQEQARQAREAEMVSRQRAEEEAARLRSENEKLKTDLIASTINSLQTNLGQQIQKLQADLAAGRTNSRSVGDQLKEIIDSAALLGYVRPDQQPKTPAVQSSTDAAISLEMLRLQLEDKRTERSFAWQMEKDRRQFQIELKKLDQANRMAAADAGSKRERDQMLVKLPEMFGAAVAKGLIASRDGGAVASNPVARRPQARPQPPPAAPPPIDMQTAASNLKPSPGQPGYDPNPESLPTRVQADIGEAGAIDCPECGSPISIGPTATRGVCAGCNYSIEIVRRGESNGAPA